MAGATEKGGQCGGTSGESRSGAPPPSAASPDPSGVPATIGGSGPVAAVFRTTQGSFG